MTKLWILLALAVAHATPVAAEGAADLKAASADTLSRIVPMPTIEVTTARAGDRAPLARATLTRADLRDRNWGQDTPMALATLPGAYAYSDAGNGIGYSYLSIRGFPQRRISVLVNGVPLNDPESHEVYWIDHPDLLASTASVQVQRGVGSALYGAASVGGSVDLETAPFGETPRLSALVASGSYRTHRYMIETDSGRLRGGWSFYGRYSRIESGGYRDQSDTELWSYALSARRTFASQSLRLNLYGGPETTHLAYLGVTRGALDGAITGDRDRDRRMNPIQYAGERDHFFEPHYEMIHAWSPSSGIALTQTWFYFDGEGYYDELRFGQSLAGYRLTPWASSDSTLYPRSHYRDADGDGNLDRDAQGRVTVERFDAVRRRSVANRHYGWVPRLRIEHAGGAVTVGGEIRAHDGRHIGTVVSGSGLPASTEPDHRYYDYHPRTLAAGLFLREEWQPRPALLATADFAWRHQGYRMRGDRFDRVHFDQSYDFGLPRLGLTWEPAPGIRIFSSAAHSRREPAFRDLYDAEGAGSVPLLVSGRPLIRPERVNDYEIGFHAARGGSVVDVNVFRMDFRDELVYAGQFNTDLGYPILGNAARSVHRGIEIAASQITGAPRTGLDAVSDPAFGRGPSPEFLLSANTTLSNNYFVKYHEAYGPTAADIVRYDGKAIGFFPNVLVNASARAGWQGVSLGLEAQHVGRIYLDNTETKTSSIARHEILNVSGGVSVPWSEGSRVELSLRVNNVFDRRYETNGYMDYDSGGSLVPVFVPAATRNWLAQVRVDF